MFGSARLTYARLAGEHGGGERPGWGSVQPGGPRHQVGGFLQQAAGHPNVVDPQEAAPREGQVPPAGQVQHRGELWTGQRARPELQRGQWKQHKTRSEKQAEVRSGPLEQQNRLNSTDGYRLHSSLQNIPHVMFNLIPLYICIFVLTTRFLKNILTTSC